MLPDFHAQAVEAVRLQIIAEMCVCGAAKSRIATFCVECYQLLDKANAIAYGSLNYYAHNNPELFRQHEWWRRFEAMADCAAAIRAGRWDGKRQRRSEAE